MNIKIEKGCALVIEGAQGSGKNTLARKLAGDLGSFEEIGLEQLGTRPFFESVMEREPRTLIVDAEFENNEIIVWIKGLLTSETFLCNRKFKSPKIVKMPNFIFCTGDADIFGESDRRFHIVKIGNRAQRRAKA